ncbi:MAG: HNH endonuclease [Candidatus Hinthialibacter antarcticus]|nr:HNH endonuclease [Candidatus Hinthialibacter antarcticus]
MKVWWCNQSEWWEKEHNESLVCSVPDEGNSTFRKTVESVKKGDVIVHCAKKKVIAFSQAMEDGKWRENKIDGEGWCFKTEYFDLKKNPIQKDKFVHILEPGKFTGYPINKNYDINQGYFYPFDEEGLSVILQYVDEPKPLPKWLENLKSFKVKLDEVSQELEEEFDPKSSKEAKEKVERSIRLRRGQPKFRGLLLRYYNGRCAVTGCNFEGALEAAHITPYNGDRTNNPQNGILLRADIHTLWDLNLIAVDPKTYKVIIHKALKKTEYEKLNGASLTLPKTKKYWPSKEALLYQLKCLKENINY